MSALLFYAALLALQLADYGYVKTMHSRLDHPSQDPLRSIYHIFGTLGVLALPALTIAGFFLFSWWLPLLAFFGNGLLIVPLIKFLNPRLFGALYVIGCFPIAVVLALILFATR